MLCAPVLLFLCGARGRVTNDAVLHHTTTATLRSTPPNTGPRSNRIAQTASLQRLYADSSAANEKVHIASRSPMSARNCQTIACLLPRLLLYSVLCSELECVGGEPWKLMSLIPKRRPRSINYRKFATPKLISALSIALLSRGSFFCSPPMPRCAHVGIHSVNVNVPAPA
jgi:hypothetical protein